MYLIQDFTLEKCESFGTTATEYGCPLITAVRVHCKLSLALLLQSMLGRVAWHRAYTLFPKQGSALARPVGVLT